MGDDQFDFDGASKEADGGEAARPQLGGVRGGGGPRGRARGVVRGEGAHEQQQPSADVEAEREAAVEGHEQGAVVDGECDVQQEHERREARLHEGRLAVEQHGEEHEQRGARAEPARPQVARRAVGHVQEAEQLARPRGAQPAARVRAWVTVGVGD